MHNTVIRFKLADHFRTRRKSSESSQKRRSFKPVAPAFYRLTRGAPCERGCGTAGDAATIWL